MAGHEEISSPRWSFDTLSATSSPSQGDTLVTEKERMAARESGNIEDGHYADHAVISVSGLP